MCGYEIGCYRQLYSCNISNYEPYNQRLAECPEVPAGLRNVVPRDSIGQISAGAEIPVGGCVGAKIRHLADHRGTRATGIEPARTSQARRWIGNICRAWTRVGGQPGVRTSDTRSGDERNLRTDLSG